MTLKRQDRSIGWSRALVLSCLIWLFVVFPALACALGWVLR